MKMAIKGMPLLNALFLQQNVQAPVQNVQNDPLGPLPTGWGKLYVNIHEVSNVIRGRLRWIVLFSRHSPLTDLCNSEFGEGIT